MGSSTAPPARMIANMKLASLAYLLVSPSLVFCFSLPRPQEESSEARQFSDDELVNYGVWGFIAGLMDYFIRQQFSTMTTTTNTTATKIADTEGDVEDIETEEDDAVIEAAGTMVEQVKKVRNKKKQKKNKKNRNKNGMKKKETQKMMEIENQMVGDDLDDATVNV